LALFPLLLWRVDALRDKASGANFAAVFLLEAALISAHNLMSLTLTAILVVWVTFETAVQHFNREASQIDPRPGLLALCALLLGVLGSATFWLPALLESDSADFENLGVAGLLDYSPHFLGMEDLLLAPPIQDDGAVNGLRAVRILGIGQWIAALIGGASATLLYIRGYRTRHPQTFLGAGCFGMLALAMIFLTTPASSTVWESLRLLRILQFPWRLLGPAAACLAIVAGMNGFWLEQLETRYQISIISLVVALPIVTAFPLLYAPEWRLASLDMATGAFIAPIYPVSTPAREMASALSAISVLILCLVVWSLRGPVQTIRPYWTAPGMTRTSLFGILLGGGIALLALAVLF
jgi:hypothetical protein